jgi:pyruvate kinase
MTQWSTIRAQLEDLRQQLLAAERVASPRLLASRGEALASLRNLIHYLALRRNDIRRLQLELGQLGLSSLGRCEGYVLASLEAVLQRVMEAEGTPPPALAGSSALGWSDAKARLHASTRAVFGPKPAPRHVYIMVTAPEPAVADDAWFTRQLEAGMNVLRINTAHGGPSDWRTLARRARSAAARSGRALRLLVDLPGPKLRTVALGEGPRVLKLKPRRDALGRVVRPARVGFLAGEQGVEVSFLPVPESILQSLRAGDTLELRDARGRRRSIAIGESGPGARLFGEVFRTTYVCSETRLTVRGADGRERATFACEGIAPLPHTVDVAVGERLLVRKVGAQVEAGLAGLPSIGCSLAEAFDAVEPGQRVMIDDGKIATRVVAAGEDYMVLKVERAKRGFAKIRGDMGLNFPDSRLDVPAVSDRDAEALGFLEEHGDLVGLSFVRSVDDVRQLERRLRRADLGLMLKIETRAGFEALPALLLDCLGRRPLAVMIARGDLAVECGFERLAEIQEEILWLCEASHVPVVWATQVLESLAKTGLPTRAEVTDAAMSVRAECVMLNKGPFIESATLALDSILRRMEAHVYKKRQLYRPLRVSLVDLAGPAGAAGEAAALAGEMAH